MYCGTCLNSYVDTNTMRIVCDKDIVCNGEHYEPIAIHKKVSIDELYNKLDEEVKEIAAAILLNDIENLTEELLDVMQVVKGIAYKFNIDLDANIEKHNKKLLSRGHKFI